MDDIFDFMRISFHGISEEEFLEIENLAESRGFVEIKIARKFNCPSPPLSPHPPRTHYPPCLSPPSPSPDDDDPADDDDDEDDDDEDEEDEDDEEDDDDYESPKRKRPTKRLRRAPRQRAAPVRPSSLKDANSQVDNFLNYYKKTVRRCDLVTLGTFEVAVQGFKLQYLSQIQPIPNSLECRFLMFGEAWRTNIDYLLHPKDGKTTVLKFSVLHLESGEMTTMTETLKEAETRHISIKPRTICNRLFLRAVGRCYTYVNNVLRGTAQFEQRLLNLSASGKGRKCTESISLFGLRSDFMRDACVEFLDKQC